MPQIVGLYIPCTQCERGLVDIVARERQELTEYGFTTHFFMANDSIMCVACGARFKDVTISVGEGGSIAYGTVGECTNRD